MSISLEVEDDYTREAAQARLRTLSEATGASLDHIGSYCFDPEEARGNVENFAGATQVPLGIAGPLAVNGEHARGEFFVPLATSEGTLVRATTAA
jgi:hydroxymethylglutaryl-CoA reductase (NADPH)